MLQFTKNKLMLFSMLGMLILSIPITLYILQSPQDIRQRAADVSVTLLPTDDAYVEQGAPTTTRPTSSNLAAVGGTNVKISYLKFDLTSLAGRTITNATLRVKVENDSSNTQSVKTVSSSTWTEATLNYNNRPALGTTITTFSNLPLNSFKDISLTAQVASQIIQTDKRLSIAIDSEGTNTFGINSKDASADKPQLIVTYSTTTATTAPSPTTVSRPSPTTVTRPSPTSTTATATPVVRTTPSPVPTTPPVGGSCPAVATDTVLIIDASGSMSNSIDEAKVAAKQFVDQAATNANNRIALIIYDPATTIVGFTNNFSSLKTAIDNIELGGGTCIQCAIEAASDLLASSARSGIKKAAVLLTDGRANKTVDGSAAEDEAEAAAITSIKADYVRTKTVYFPIGLSDAVRGEFLQEIATTTGGKYYFSPTSAELSSIYQEIAGLIGKGSVTGTIFNDANANGSKDTSEVVLAGWVVQLKNASGVSLGSSTSTAEGAYTFTGICEGNGYVVDAQTKTGWSQTLPTNDAPYTINIVNGSAITQKNFGFKNVPPTPTSSPTPTKTPTPTPTRTPTPFPPNLNFTANPTNIPYNETATLTWTTTDATSCTASVDWTGAKPTAGSQSTGQLTESQIYTLQCTGPGGSVTKTVTITVQPAPTATPVPQNTILNFSTFLHSIGNSGDNANPTAHSLSNKNPLHPQRDVIVSIFNEANTPVATKSGTMLYNQINGNFTGTVDIGNAFPSGKYTVVVKTDLFLQNSFPGIQTITAGQQNQLSTATLVAGDTDQNNKLNILDYNRLLDCYTSDLKPTPRDCPETKRLMTDINDQGTVDRYDYNIFLRELSVQSGFSL